MERQPADRDRSLRPLLAVYGTLRSGERNSVLLRATVRVGAGWTSGTLRHVLDDAPRSYPYPALLTGPDAQDAQVRADDGRGRVRVEVVELGAPEVLAAVDALEAYDPDDPEASEYVRETVDVVLDDGRTVRAWAYVYAGDPARLGAEVAGGDWGARQRP